MTIGELASMFFDFVQVLLPHSPRRLLWLFLSHKTDPKPASLDGLATLQVLKGAAIRPHHHYDWELLLSHLNLALYTGLTSPPTRLLSSIALGGAYAGVAPRYDLGGHGSAVHTTLPQPPLALVVSSLPLGGLLGGHFLVRGARHDHAIHHLRRPLAQPNRQLRPRTSGCAQ